jgi:hypothetical protein
MQSMISDNLYYLKTILNQTELKGKDFKNKSNEDMI